MAQTREECLEFLKEAKTALEELQVLKTEEANLAGKEEQLEKSLAAEKRKMNDEIQQTVKRRRDEVHATYNRELGKVQDQLKKVRARREKARNQGVRERIAEETQPFINENKTLTARIKNEVSQNRMPFYCMSPLYYSLYFPRHFHDFLRLILFVIIFFGALPCGLYWTLPQKFHMTLMLAVIYMADLLIFGGLYIYIGNSSKIRFMDKLKECRGMLDHIHENRKKIHSVTRGIRRDNNESLYNLGKFDDEISRLQQEQEQTERKKREAVDTYENVTKNILTDEIESKYRERLDTIESDHLQAEELLKQTRQELKAKNLHISDHYSGLLGKEFLDPAKVARLCLLIQDGYASSISEAINRYNQSENK